MDYSVDFPEVRKAGDRFDTMHSTGEGLLGQFQGVPLVESDFGRIPWLQSRVWDAFSEHTSDCDNALQELTQTLATIHEGLNACADTYENYEKSAEQACIQFFGAVG